MLRAVSQAGKNWHLGAKSPTRTVTPTQRLLIYYVLSNKPSHFPSQIVRNSDITTGTEEGRTPYGESGERAGVVRQTPDYYNTQ